MVMSASAPAGQQGKGRGDARSCNVKLLHSLRDVHARLLDVVLDAVEERALVDNERAEVLEELCELRDRLGDLRQLAVARARAAGAGVEAEL